jgi:flagellar hook-basal body complex protein FliE
MIEAIGAMSEILSDLQSLAGAVTAPQADPPVSDAAGAAGTAGPTFTQALQSALGNVDGSISKANAATQAFAAGDQSIPLSDVMISLEQANLALQMASGVRDKVVAAYSNVMNMQV